MTYVLFQYRHEEDQLNGARELLRGYRSCRHLCDMEVQLLPIVILTRLVYSTIMSAKSQRDNLYASNEGDKMISMIERYWNNPGFVFL